ncbi:related to MAP kinase [Melanopsichium pennsylvanicum]|uniref:Mitogen-activated protein kinase n=2 Tax=Melanopsichium pennsylvanicum TaxID=63383 RepID=A0AAJ5C8K4_9BASI|nr:related to MAP kinase [Melanopsichium pennsylvanicum]
MPAPQATPPSPHTNANTAPDATAAAAAASTSNVALAGYTNTTPPPPSPSSSSSVVHQLGSRQATRTRTRTRRNMSSSASGSHRIPRYTNQDHPMAAHNLQARGYHSFRCLGVPFHVKQRYTFLRELGIGAYGCVALCRDHVLDCNVAIKKVTRIFEKDVLARRALREVALLRHIGMCDNVTALLDFDTAFIDFSEIYLVLSASEADLSQIIRSGQALSDAHHQYFMAQILRGVRYMHEAKVIHRDLKPSNLLVNGDCALRICDFGLARAYAQPDEFLAPPASNDDAQVKPKSSISSIATSSAHADRPEVQLTSIQDAATSTQQQPRSGSARSPSPAYDLHVQLYKADSKGKQKRLNYPGGPLTGYVATRWYRAPEVMLCFREGYGPEMDMWSVGCILAELIAGAPIFGGKDYVDQIARINNVLGSPSEALLDKIGSERAKTYIKSLPNMPAVPLENLYPNANPEALDLVAKLLTWDPDQRLTADQALKHPWLKAYHESNAKWQPPQPFDRFVEVEFIHSLNQFKRSLQSEADEMRIELEELEEEEMEHLGNRAQENDANREHAANGTSNGAHQDDGERPQHQQQCNAEARQEINRHHANANANGSDVKADSGNVQRAHDAVDSHNAGIDADAPFLEPSVEPADQETDADALSCNASTPSGHLPADTASSSSSIHTPSSASGASADETEPASPRLYAACRLSATALKSRAEHLGEGNALRKPPSFFRLGHEAPEGHLFASYDEGAEVHFMPNQVLTVARGLVEYNQAAANGATEQSRTFLPYDAKHKRVDGRGLSSGGTIKASSCVTAHSSGVAGGGSGGKHNSTSGASSGKAGGGGGSSASTPSLGQSLLNDTLFVPADGSSSGLKSVSSNRHGRQLVILQDSLVQSSTALMRQLIYRSSQRDHGFLLISTLRAPQTYLDGLPASERITTVDATTLGNPYVADKVGSVNDLVSRIQADLAALNANVSKTTVLIDSLNVVAHTEFGVVGASKLVRETLSSIGASSRLIVGLQMGGVEASTCASLLSALHSPLIWGPSTIAAGSGGSGGTVLSATIHAPALLKHIFKAYSLKPPSSCQSVQKALDILSNDAGQGTEVDTRFWDVLRNVASRGPWGVAPYEVGGGSSGWWNRESLAFESLCIANELSSNSGDEGQKGVISLSDLVNSARTGYALLELHYQSRSGKKYEEMVAICSSTGCEGGGLLTLATLDMADHSTTSAKSGSASNSSTNDASGADKHSSMMSTLPFNLSETKEQRSRRETVALPYAYHQQQSSGSDKDGKGQVGEREGEDAAVVGYRGSTGKAKIFFEAEDDDDEDDEDPDDDLDL